MADRLTSLTAVKAELGYSANNDDLYLYQMIDAASDAIESWCGRSFGLKSYTEVFTAAPSDQIMFSERPIVSVDAMSICNTPYKDLSRLVLDSQKGLVSYAGGWPGPNVLITYQAGYGLPLDDWAEEYIPPGYTVRPERTLPYDIERAAILFVKRAFMARDRDPSLRSKGMSAMEEISYFAVDPNNIAPDVVSLLARHCEVYI